MKPKSFISSVLAVVLAIASSGCAESMVIDGRKYKPYGALNESEVHDSRVQYQPSMSSITWALILCETVVVPIYVFGFAMYEPIGPKATAGPHG